MFGKPTVFIILLIISGKCFAEDTQSIQEGSDPFETAWKLLNESDSGANASIDPSQIPAPVKTELLSLCAQTAKIDCLGAIGADRSIVDAANHAGTTALFVATSSGQLASVKKLLELGADPLKPTNLGSPSDIALQSGQPDLIRLLIPDIDQRAQTPLFAAAQNDDLLAFEDARRLGADVNAANKDGLSVLALAVSLGGHQVVEELLKAGARPSAPEGSDADPLAIAILNADLRSLELLLPLRDPNQSIAGTQPLSMAAMTGNPEVVEMLLKAGADPENTGEGKARPAAIAKMLGFDDLSKRLGGAPELEPAPDIFLAIQSKDTVKVKVALEAGADPNSKTQDGYPALVYAAATSTNGVVRAMLDAGSDRFSVGPQGMSVLHAAYANPAASERSAIVRSVLSSADGATISRLLSMKDASGRSAAVMIARDAPKSRLITSSGQGGLSPVVGKLWPSETQAIDYAEDTDGMTPLAAAILSGNGPATAALVEGLQTLPPFKDGTTPQELARGSGNVFLLSVLPSDRILPADLKKGAPLQTLTAFQQLLHTWGYYTGKVDGVFGAGSRSSVIAFFKERDAEIRQILTDQRGGLLEFQFKPGQKTNGTKFNAKLKFAGDPCVWKLVEWYPKQNNSTRFIGCIGEGETFPGYGIGYVEYADGTNGLFLFGSDGWDGMVELVSAQNAPEAGGDWFVILGSYPHAEIQEASNKQTELEQRGIDAEVINTDDYSDFTPGFYSIVMGPYSKPVAQDRLSSAKAMVNDAYIAKGALSNSHANGTWKVREGVSGGYQNVRAGAGTSFEVLFTIPAGQGGIIIEECATKVGKSKWCKIGYNGSIGWLAESGIEPE